MIKLTRPETSIPVYINEQQITYMDPEPDRTLIYIAGKLYPLFVKEEAEEIYNSIIHKGFNTKIKEER